MNTYRDTFRAAVVTTPSGPDSIEIVDIPVRQPADGEVRVAVAAASINPVDLAVSSGFFHSVGVISGDTPVGLGMDFAGTVLESGVGVDLAPGTRVAGSCPASTIRRAPTPTRSWSRLTRWQSCRNRWTSSPRRPLPSMPLPQSRSSTFSASPGPAATDYS
ncbi:MULTISPECIES: alcohol dehydrogenase catalytic domain-containing protein [Gordonia]|uniref:alcohol dehydrogenase catalytic domain-containing protein n=1 Tax=Gordonia TaxID=2053 RepID=UPI0003F90A6D|nr:MULTISPECIES: alcohol dehydrogenase catalytic domain-containing protein [Gordonia]MDH3009178.1 hypothetical protein [Gordonia alkanivorans]MDH3013001.1 hypothetical protein [Gordonia alkanivorans]MDH3015148.1 hypothetical protein [Gordonia alkanivorans]MDH3024201.1 hypothetical protein [Gordonia alkanivorans]MDH3040042.1 hypothetical protein [Gordonia alkanivorans]